MKTNQKIRGDLDTAVLLILAWLLSTFCMTYLGWDSGRNAVQREAVKLNYAKWVPDADGNVSFVWNTPVK